MYGDYQYNKNQNENCVYDATFKDGYASSRSIDFGFDGKKKKSSRTLSIFAIIISCIVLFISLASLACNLYLYDIFKDEIKDRQSLTPSSTDSKIVLNTTPEGVMNAAEIYRKVSKSVAYIEVDGGSGSGFVISKDGYLLTNEHVVSNTRNIKVKLQDKTYDATLVGKDAKTDLAVIKIDAKNLAPVEFAPADQVLIGSWVCAIGSPYGIELESTITQGIISGKRENILINGYYMSLLQTDAAINPGNSGGPLIDSYGRVVGVNSSKIISSSNGTVTEGLGFAIPTDVIEPIVADIMENGYVKNRPMIGIKGTAVEFNGGVAIQVAFVSPSSDAYAKGLQAGDYIIKINNKTFDSFAEFENIKSSFEIGDSVKLTINRKNKVFDITIVIMEAEPEE